MLFFFPLAVIKTMSEYKIYKCFCFCVPLCFLCEWYQSAICWCTQVELLLVHCCPQVLLNKRSAFDKSHNLFILSCLQLPVLVQISPALGFSGMVYFIIQRLSKKPFCGVADNGINYTKASSLICRLSFSTGCQVGQEEKGCAAAAVSWRLTWRTQAQNRSEEHKLTLRQYRQGKRW